MWTQWKSNVISHFVAIDRMKMYEQNQNINSKARGYLHHASSIIVQAKTTIIAFKEFNFKIKFTYAMPFTICVIFFFIYSNGRSFIVGCWMSDVMLVPFDIIILFKLLFVSKPFRVYFQFFKDFVISGPRLSIKRKQIFWVCYYFS